MTTKILYLADCFESPHAGTEGQLVQLVQGLDRSRYEPKLAFLRSTKHVECGDWPCSVEVLHIGRLASVRTMAKVVRYAMRLRAEGYRIVHCFFNDASIIAPVFKLFGIYTVVSRRDMGFWYSTLNLAVLRLAVPWIDRYVVNSQAVREAVHRREWIPQKKISVIYNGCVVPLPVDDESAGTVALPGVPSGAPVIGIVANLRPIKRIDTLIRALAIVRRRHADAHVVILGADIASPSSEGVQQRLTELAKQLGILAHVVFAGQVNNPSRYLHRFDVAVLCSESEGLSNALIEYMHAARPIVCTRAGGNPELIQDGCTGFLVPVDDPQALADRIDRLLSDRVLALRLGQCARIAVRSICNHTRMIAEQMSCYDQICSSRRAAKPRARIRREARP